MRWTLNHQNILEMAQGHISLSGTQGGYAPPTMETRSRGDRKRPETREESGAMRERMRANEIGRKP
jgi:hypothetical protein